MGGRFQNTETRKLMGKKEIRFVVKLSCLFFVLNPWFIAIHMAHFSIAQIAIFIYLRTWNAIDDFVLN